MKQKSFMRFRMELLQVGEELGWPRLPVGQFPPIRAGQSMWEKAARGHAARVVAALRNAKIRRDNLGGQKDTELSRVVTFDVSLREVDQKTVTLADRRREILAKARAAKAAKKEAALSQS